MTVYCKLVRDRIPDIIKKSGKQLKTKVLDEHEFEAELKKKAQEELQEYFAATNDKESLEELADLLEIIRTLARLHGASMAKLEQIRKNKELERGGFQDRIFLMEVEE
ncbi:MAG: nucleoside triphosphate pyrophosphohydrolase [Bacillaceae bacterium]|nr:nucleoside triphosphate pyrophosphohydrolase [Bacillaceae bacterium]